MRKILFMTLSILILTISSAFATDDAKLVLAKELLSLTVTQQSINQIMNAIKQMQLSQMKQMEPSKSESAEINKMNDKMMKLIGEELTEENIKNDFARIYADKFTEQELKDIITFYKSTTGQKMIKVTPEIAMQSMQKTMERMAPKMKQFADEIKSTK